MSLSCVTIQISFCVSFWNFAPHAGSNDVDEDQQELDKQNLKPFRKAFKNTIIAAGGYFKDNAEEELESGDADLICYGMIPVGRYMLQITVVSRNNVHEPFCMRIILRAEQDLVCASTYT